MKSIFSLLKKKNYNLSCITQDKSQSPSTGLHNLISPHIYRASSLMGVPATDTFPSPTPTSHVPAARRTCTHAFLPEIFFLHICHSKISAQMVPFQRPSMNILKEMQTTITFPSSCFTFLLSTCHYHSDTIY